MGEEYVVFGIWETVDTIKEYEQYVTPGYDSHDFYIIPKPVKVVYKDGAYYDKKGEKVRVSEEVVCSYITDSSYSRSVAMAPFSQGMKETALGKGYEESFFDRRRFYGYAFPIPLKEFKKSKSAKEAFKKFFKKILPVGYVRLSYAPEEVKEDLAKLGIDITLMKKDKQAKKR